MKCENCNFHSYHFIFKANLPNGPYWCTLKNNNISTVTINDICDQEKCIFQIIIRFLKDTTGVKTDDRDKADDKDV